VEIQRCTFSSNDEQSCRVEDSTKSEVSVRKKTISKRNALQNHCDPIVHMFRRAGYSSEGRCGHWFEVANSGRNKDCASRRI
jgi:hypothetical protein